MERLALEIAHKIPQNNFNAESDPILAVAVIYATPDVNF